MTKQDYIGMGFPEVIKRNGRVLRLSEFKIEETGGTVTVRHGNDICGVYVDRARHVAYPMTLKEVKNRCQIIGGNNG